METRPSFVDDSITLRHGRPCPIDGPNATSMDVGRKTGAFDAVFDAEEGVSSGSLCNRKERRPRASRECENGRCGLALLIGQLPPSKGSRGRIHRRIMTSWLQTRGWISGCPLHASLAVVTCVSRMSFHVDRPALAAGCEF